MRVRASRWDAPRSHEGRGIGQRERSPSHSDQEGRMTKAELIDRMADTAGISKTSATKALSAMVAGITGALKKGQRVSLVGFGTFAVSKRKARIGRNPRTGEAIKIAATKVPRFSAGKTFKSAIR
ncbi:MAG: HU family DNA-binding protein [Nitrospirota bacterium]